MTIEKENIIAPCRECPKSIREVLACTDHRCPIFLDWIKKEKEKEQAERLMEFITKH